MDNKNYRGAQDPPLFAFDRNLSTTENFTYEKNSKLENYGRESNIIRGRKIKGNLDALGLSIA